MRRWPVKALVCLLAVLGGAIVNVVVALACAWNLPSAGFTSPDRTLNAVPEDLTWLDPICVEQEQAFHVHEVRRFGGSLRKAGPENWPNDAPPPFYVEWQTIESGWPCTALRGHWWVKTMLAPTGGAPTVAPYVKRGLHNFIYTLNGKRDKRAIPYFVDPVGFPINTIVYAAMLWLLFAATKGVRRWRRIRRGLCPACGYPVGTSGTCTECGKLLTPHTA